MAKPFQITSADRKSEKGKSYTNAPRDIGGRLWANLEFNGAGDYGFKDKSFSLKIKFATGVIDAAGHKWLVGSFENGESLFDIKDQVVNGTKPDGKPKYEASPNEEKLKQDWEADGKLCAILCDSIPQLAYFVEDAALGKLVYEDNNYEVFVGTNPDRALLKEIVEEIVEEKPDNPSPQRRKNATHKKFLEDNSWFFFAWDEEAILGCFEETPFECDSIEELPEGFEIEFDEDDLLASIKLPWIAPEVVEQKKRGGGGYGASSQDEKDILAEREAFIFQRLGVKSWDEAVAGYGSTLCPIKCEWVTSVANGSQWHNRFYHKVVDEKTYSTFSVSNQNGNGHVEHKEENVEEPAKSKRGRKKKEDVETVVEEIEEYTEDEVTYPDENKYIPLILKLKEEDYLIPKEFDEIALEDKGEVWCRLFYQVMSGGLITPKGTIGFKERNSTSFVKSKFGKFPQAMNEQELKKVLSSDLFIAKTDEIEAL